MNTVPIVPHFRSDPTPESLLTVERLAEQLRIERPELVTPDQFCALAAHTLEDGPTLHIDDFSEIPYLARGRDVRFYQDRARLRAGDLDLVATCADPIPGYEEYCRDNLGLGSPYWLRPEPPHVPLRIAEACWEDDGVRSMLIERATRDQLRYIHPHMGTFGVWELAFLLHHETNRPISVIAPTPGVSRLVNDKIAFTNIVTRLLGPEFVPHTESASNFAYMAKRVKDLASECESIGLKLPSSGGGDGNLVLDAKQFRDSFLHAIRQTLKESLSILAWDGASPLMIDTWETEVVCSPSAQMWIPPIADGAPIVEGIFIQSIEGVEGSFVGNIPAHFPNGLSEQITSQCSLLAYLFQELGYVGRCSFDMILVGKNYDDCRVEFIECNGRWGGTSLPMTLMNRIFGDWVEHPYAVHVAHDIPRLYQVSFNQVLDFFRDDLFDTHTGKGLLIFINPGRLHYQSGITTIAIASTWDDAAKLASDMPRRLEYFAKNIFPTPELLANE